MATITWSIQSIECLKEVDTYTDVVYTVWWQLSATDGNYIASMHGSQTVTFDPTVSGYQFIPYDQLDEQTVLNWMKSAMGQATVDQNEATALLELDQQMQSPKEFKPLPWMPILQ